MKKYLSCKGQSLVEFALLLAFVACVFAVPKSGLLDAIGSVFDPAAKVLGAIDHYRTFDVIPAIEVIMVMQYNGNYQQQTGANHIHYNRGQIRSGWVDKHPEDVVRPEIAKLYNELGASQWTLYNGLGGVYRNKPHTGGFYSGDKGLFWTVQELSTAGLTINSLKENYNYSKELVLQYFYSTVTGRYYVIKSHVWMNQGDTGNHIALGGLRQAYQKPSGYFVDGCTDGFATLLEAKALFERVRTENGGSVVFPTPDTEHDINANDYLFDV